MCKYIPAVFLLILLSSSVTSKKRTGKPPNIENDVIEKSEVTLKFPTYALKMPPMISIRRRSNAAVDPVPGFAIVSCSSANVTKALSELRKKIQCVPRETVVDVIPPDDSTVSPNTVVVKRCGGMCSGSKKCVSAKKKPVEFYVRTTTSKSRLVFCNSIIVTEDVECKCACGKKKKKCLPVQKFDTNICKCVCHNNNEYDECLAKSELNVKWDPKTCSCLCKHEKQCTTGTVWSSTKCRCVKT